jgi:hypothetical protein
MENYALEKDITVFCVTADFSPDAILKAHQKLHAMIPYTSERRYFGLSRPNEHGIVTYEAAAEELIAGEGKKLGLETIVLKKGNYTSTIIKGYKKNVSEIGLVFSKLLQNKYIDPEGYCVEWYLNDDDVQCMVRLTK